MWDLCCALSCSLTTPVHIRSTFDAFEMCCFLRRVLSAHVSFMLNPLFVDIQDWVHFSSPINMLRILWWSHLLAFPSDLWLILTREHPCDCHSGLSLNCPCCHLSFARTGCNSGNKFTRDSSCVCGGVALRKFISCSDVISLLSTLQLSFWRHTYEED